VSLFVTFEGPEGAGKSTQVALLRARLEETGWRVRCVREPGATALGDRLRPLLLGAGDWRVGERAEALLYAAARAQLVAEVIQPALAEDAVVLSDRYADSTLAYQGYGRGIPLGELRPVLRFAVGSCWPDLTFLLDLPVGVGLRRKGAAADTPGGEWTRFEAEALAFHERVRAGYLQLAAAEPGRWIVLDATVGAPELQSRIWQELERRLLCAPPRGTAGPAAEPGSAARSKGPAQPPGGVVRS
jgi:dTMP kinase